MPETCLVCKAGGGPAFKFPRDDQNLKLWMNALGLVAVPRKGARVCYRHFDFDDIYENVSESGKKSRMLVRGAVPNIQHNANGKAFVSNTCLNTNETIKQEATHEDNDRDEKDDEEDDDVDEDNIGELLDIESFMIASITKEEAKDQEVESIQSGQVPVLLKNQTSSISQYLLEENMIVSDVRIICQDGSLASHRLVLASISPMLREAMKNNDSDEDVITLLIPHFSVDEVKNFLRDLISGKDLSRYAALMKLLGLVIKDVVFKQVNALEYPANGKNVVQDSTAGDHETVERGVTVSQHQVKTVLNHVVKEECESKPFLEENIKNQNKLQFKKKFIPPPDPKPRKNPEYTKHSTKDPANPKRRICKYCGKSIGSHFYEHLSQDHNIIVKYQPSRKLSNNKSQHFTQDPDCPRKRLCKYCEKPFYGTSNLAKHLKFKHQIIASEQFNRTYPCSFCGKEFNRSDNRNLHESNVHRKDGKFQCNQCEVRCHTKQNLEVHMRVHTGEKPYQCNYCGKCFSQKNGLSNHVRLHTGEKPFQCNKCDKTFAQKSALQSHMLIHSDEKPHVCQYCGEKFKFKHNLKKHMERSHTEDGYVATKRTCDLCGKEVQNMSGHKLEYHGVEKQCPQCDFKTKYTQSMNSHIKQVHEGKPFRESCHICGIKTSNLDSHMKRFHT